MKYVVFSASFLEAWTTVLIVRAVRATLDGSIDPWALALRVG